MTTVRSYTDLIVWQKAIELVIGIYQATKGFPKEELYGLTSQMRRAAVSVPSNIAEGQGRLSTGEFKQFLGHARASLLELETQLHISLRLGYLQGENSNPSFDLCSEVGWMLNGLLASLEDKQAQQATTGH